MASNGLTACDNSPDEILETVREVDALAGGMPSADDRLIDVWRQSLGAPHAYGASLPSLHFLRKHAAAFLDEITE
jgi:hypothetical protein